MIKLERILCPTDLSADSERTIRYAVVIARTVGAKLFVCHRPKSESNHETDLATIERLVNAGMEFPSGATDDPLAIDWEAVLLEGSDLGQAITREAGLRQADLILMRSRRRPFAAAILGSTAETVFRLAPSSVLIMHADEREWLDNATGQISLQNVLVAYDFSAHSQLALQYTLALAKQYQSTLHMLHVLPPPVMDQPEIAWVGDAEVQHDQAMSRLQEAIPSGALISSNLRHSVQYGKPYAEILAYAKNNQIDLIAMGAHGAGFGIQTLFGSNVDRVLRQAECPLLVAHPTKTNQNLSALT